jgi:hypothetical protein
MWNGRTDAEESGLTFRSCDNCAGFSIIAAELGLR